MKLGDRLAQQFKPLANKIRLLDRDSGKVAGRMRQALDQAAANRIERNGKDDRNGRYCLPEDSSSDAIRDDDVNFAPFEFSGEFTHPIGSSVCPAIFDRQTIALAPT